MLEAGEVPQCGPSGDRHGALHASQGLESVDHWGETPGVPLVLECLLQTLEPLGMFRKGPDVCLADALRRRGGPDDLAAPPQVGGVPGGLTRLLDILPQEEGLKPKFRGLEIAASLFPCPAQVSDRFIVHLGDVDGGAVP